MDELVYWIWLSLSCTPDSATFSKLIASFPDAKSVYQADYSDIVKCVGNKATDRVKFESKDLTDAERIYTFCKKHNVGLLPYSSEAYPESLRQIKTPPVLLYYRGKLPDFNRDFFVASVGTRSISDYGRKNAFKISYDLASSGAIVVSGMAMGIDGVSHAGALSAGMPTVAVLGCGIDVCYPKGHLKLAREIVKNGCVLTEYAPGTPPDKFNFPRRNRIISGLSAATLVIEGRERSGSLITARCAFEQGRVVYALPGNVGDKGSEVTSLLLKDGARIFTRAEDIIKDFSESYRGMLNPFLLKEKCPVDMMSALSSLGVIANCPGDKIYEPPRNVKKPEYISSQSEINHAKTQEDNPDMSGFDKNSLAVYKKIPCDSQIEIEALVDDKMNLRDVMKALLKLEMASFITMLPGERVERKRK